MFPSYRRTAAERQARLLVAVGLTGIALYVAAAVFLAYAAVHFIFKFW